MDNNHNTVLGNKIIKLDSVDSTNSYTHQLLHKEPTIDEGTVVCASYQKSGRGQRGKMWDSEKGKNLTFSIVLFPDFLESDVQFLISKAVALGIRDFLDEVLMSNTDSGKAKVAIKWPNDIYVNERKICGVLIENSVSRYTITHSVVGIGINVNQDNFNTRLVNPTSMKLETGIIFNLNDVLKDLLYHIGSRYFEIKTGDQKIVNKSYINALYQLKEWKSYGVKGKRMRARIVDVSSLGNLILERADNTTIACDNNDLEYI
jgi:BirA family biotin operon repressor/biotin-[acetyl-CoA-carboxylase] ligase